MKEVLWQVVIADVRASRRFTAAQRARVESDIKRAMAQTVRWAADAFRLAPQVLKGDEIQMLLRPDADSLMIATYLRARLALATTVAVELRVGIGGGRVDRLNPRGPFESDGPAFHFARAALEHAEQSGGTRRTAWALGDAFFDPVADTILGVTDAVMTRWTSAQWEAVLGRLEGKGLREIAKASRVTLQSVSKRLLAASWNEVQAAFSTTEKMSRVYLLPNPSPRAIQPQKVEKAFSTPRG